jgi:hypothetical protein
MPNYYLYKWLLLLAEIALIVILQLYSIVHFN